MNDSQYLMDLSRMINMAEDELRARIDAVSPDIRYDTHVIADLLRELVRIDRAKMGLDEHMGKLMLAPNKEKTSENKQPDLLGTGRVAGHHYKAAGWIKGDSLEIVLSEPRKR